MELEVFLFEKPVSGWCYSAKEAVPVHLPGDVLLLGLPLRGALHIPHQRFDVGRRDGRNHLHVLS